jgi:O-antigen ligase
MHEAAHAHVAPAHDQPTGIGWALLAVAFATPWLLPIHFDPWTTFYGEALAALILAPVAAWALAAGGRGGWKFDALSASTAVLAVVPLLQALGGLFVFQGESWLVSLYLCASMSAMVLARRAEECAPYRLIDALFAGLAIAALLSTGLTIYQWLDLNIVGELVRPMMPGGRAAANLAQPNNLATLIVWGIVATWWGLERRRIGPTIACIAVAFLLVGVALTRSRTGWLLVALLDLAAFAFIRVGGRRANRWAIAALLGWFALLVIGLEPVSQYLWREAPQALSNELSIGRRPLIWQLAATAILHRPWFGYGWNQSVQAHVELFDAVSGLYVTVQHAHNVLLDLLLWNGVPLGALLIAGLGVWFWRQWRASKTHEQLLVLLALAVFLVHAMLELPHAYAFFLLPVAMMMGFLNARARTPTWFSLPRWLMGCILLGQFVLLGVVVDEYQRVERALGSARIADAGIYNPRPEPLKEPVFLAFLRQALENLRMEPRAGVDSADIDRLRRTLQRYPSYGGLFRFAQLAALNGRPDEAQWALSVLCKLNTPAACAAAIDHWRDLAAQLPALAAISTPSAVGPSKVN